MRTIRVFVSSPSDAAQERNRVSRVAARLNARYRAVLTVEIIRWEDDFYKAHETFQTQIAEARDCDIVIGILKHRLGSPLPEDFPRMPAPAPFLGERYPSGTAYEILSSIAARVVDGAERPDVYVLRDSEPPRIVLGSGDAGRIAEEWQRLEAFIRRFFFTEAGEFRFAIDSYAATDQFEARIEALLEKWIATHIRSDERITWPVALNGSPFRGLDSFDYAHRHVFFGRSRDIERALALVRGFCEAPPGESRRAAFLLVLGPSGSGKSSLIRAGIVPALAGGETETADEWRIATMKPSEASSPFEALALALAGPSTPAAAGAPRAVPEIARGPFARPEALAALFAAGGLAAVSTVNAALDAAADELAAREDFSRRPVVRLLLVVDQLDDLFSGAVAADHRAAFTQLIADLAVTDRIVVVASLRAGLYEQVLNDAVLSPLRQAGAMLELASPGTAELAEIVRLPAVAAGLAYERHPETGEGLDEALLRDFDRPDMLPLLQFALDRLFVARREEDGRALLTFAAYEAMNGLTGAVASVAADAMQGLDETARSRLPRLLRLLVQRMPGPADSETAHSLIEASLDEIAADPPLGDLAARLIAARLLVECRTAAGSRGVRLSHQRLLTVWPEAARAMQENAFFLRVKTEVGEALHRFERNGRRFSGVIRDPVLLAEAARLAREYAGELPAPLTQFIARSRLRARLGGIGLSVVALALAGLSVAAVLSYRQAEDNLALATATLDGVVSDIADGLRNVTGMTLESRRKILDRVQQSVTALESQAGASDRFALTRWRMLIVTGDSAAAGGDGETAEQLFRQALAEAEQQQAKTPDEPGWQRNVAVSLERLGDLLVRQGKRAEASAAYERSLTLSRALAGKLEDWVSTVDLAISMDRVSSLRELEGDLAGALAASEEALALRQKLVMLHADPRWNRDVAATLLTISQLETALGRTAAAEDHLTQAVLLSRAFAKSDPDNSDFAATLFSALNLQADRLSRGGKRAEAAETNAEALALARRMIAADPDNAGWHEYLANALERRGNYALIDDRFAEAAAAYREIVETAGRLLEADPANLDYRNQLAIGTMRLADVEMQEGKPEAARRHFEEALAMRRAMTASDPDNMDLLDTQNVVEMRLADLAEKQGDTAGALTFHRAAADSARRLSRAAEGSPDYQVRLFTRLIKAGDALLALDRPKEAVPLLAEALPLGRSFAGSGSDSDRRDLTVVLDKLGLAERRAGDLAAAREHGRESVALSRRLLGEKPDDLQRARDLLRGLTLAAETETAAGDAAARLTALAEAARLLRLHPQDDEILDLALEASRPFAEAARQTPEHGATALALRAGILETARVRRPKDAGLLASAVDLAGWQAEAVASDPAAAEAHLRRGMALAAERAGLLAEDPEARRLLVRESDRLAAHLFTAGRFAEARALYEQGLASAHALSAADPGNAVYRRDMMVAAIYAGSAAGSGGERSAAAAFFAEAVEHARVLATGPAARERQPRLDLVRALYNRAETTEGETRRAALSEARDILRALKADGQLEADQIGWIEEIDALLSPPG